MACLSGLCLLWGLAVDRSPSDTFHQFCIRFAISEVSSESEYIGGPTEAEAEVGEGGILRFVQLSVQGQQYASCVLNTP
jgi:hypothetical protein